MLDGNTKGTIRHRNVQIVAACELAGSTVMVRVGGINFYWTYEI